MHLLGDDRAQSVVIGSLLIFTILILSFSGYQAFVVPNENKQVEFSHNQEVRSQLLDLRSNVLQAAGTGTTQSATVALGTQYPSRTVAVNPAPPSGTLETTPERALILRNASAPGETGDYWDGVTDRRFKTQAIAYRPNYNVYQEAPRSRIEHGVYYDEFDEGTVIVKGEQPIVSGRSLSFVLVDGEYSRSESGTVSVDVDPVSTSSNRVTVADGAGPIEIELRTDIPETVWVAELLAAQIDGADDSDTTCADVGTVPDQDEDRYIHDCEYDAGTNPNTLTLVLEAGETYNLRLAKVGIGPQVSQPSSTYITDIEGDGTAIPDGGEQRLVAEIRDEFDNPVSGVEACAEVTSGSALGTIEEDPPTDSSDANGLVSFTFDAADGVSGDAEITVGYSCTGSDKPRTTTDTEFATFEVTIYDTGGGGGGGNSPSVTIDSVTDVSTGGADKYEVTASASDTDGDLNEMTFELRDTAGTTVDSVVVPVSGSSTTETETLQAGGQDTDSQYDIVVTATDSQGNSDSASRTVSGSG